MRIEDMRSKDKETTIKDIEIGECFIDWDNELNMRVNSSEQCNAVLLSTGQLWTCDENSPITPVKTHIVIESEE